MGRISALTVCVEVVAQWKLIVEGLTKLQRSDNSAFPTNMTWYVQCSFMASVPLHMMTIPVL